MRLRVSADLACDDSKPLNPQPLPHLELNFLVSADLATVEILLENSSSSPSMVAMAQIKSKSSLNSPNVSITSRALSQATSMRVELVPALTSGGTMSEYRRGAYLYRMSCSSAKKPAFRV